MPPNGVVTSGNGLEVVLFSWSLIFLHTMEVLFPQVSQERCRHQPTKGLGHEAQLGACLTDMQKALGLTP